VAADEASVVVLGHLEAGEGEAIRLVPEGFFKGPVQSQPLVLTPGWGSCMVFFETDSRMVVFLKNQESWPSEGDIYVLEDGRAESVTGTDVGSEEDFLAEVRGITEQFAVPAASESEGEGIEWGARCCRSVALGIVFVIGLFLMRIWHRIDPS
jgi:hypothetical protein